MQQANNTSTDSISEAPEQTQTSEPDISSAPMTEQPAPPAPPSDAPVARGNAPWERAGASHRPPTDPIAQQRAAKWVKQAGKPESREERRKRREEERQRKREEEQRILAEKLEANARRMYIAGFFGLPFVWLVALIYYRQEHKDENGNPRIKQYYRSARFWFIIYTTVFVAWFIVFQVLADELQSINIKYFEGDSPSGL